MPRKPKHTPRKAAASAESRRASDVTPLVIACAVFVLCCLYVMPFIPDDAFISFRYAENLVEGHGLAFNAGEPPVEAYSNLLWILVCALLHAVGFDLATVTPFAGIALSAGAIVVFWRLIRNRLAHSNQLYLPLLLFATSGPFVLYVVSGMESALFTLLLLLLVLALDRFVAAPSPRGGIALAAAGFAVALTRPEGAVALPVALAYALWTARRNGEGGAWPRTVRGVTAGAAVFALAFVAYHAWRVSYFGEWLPTPFMSKGAEGSSLIDGWGKNANRYFVNWAYYAPPLGYYFVALVAVSMAAIRLRSGGARVESAALLLALVLAGVYMNFVDWMPAMRYHAAIVGLLLVPAASLQLAIPAPRWQLREPVARRVFGFTVAAAVLFGALNLAHLKMVTDRTAANTEDCLVPLATWMRESLPPGSLLAMGDVGIVPYYSRLRTVDIHPESLTDLHIAKGAFSAEYLLDRDPDVVALSVRGIYSPRMDPLHYALYRNERFSARYNFVGTVRNQWYEDRSYWVFLRKTVPIHPQQLAQFPNGIGQQQNLGFTLPGSEN